MVVLTGVVSATTPLNPFLEERPRDAKDLNDSSAAAGKLAPPCTVVSLRSILSLRRKQVENKKCFYVCFFMFLHVFKIEK